MNHIFRRLITRHQRPLTKGRLIRSAVKGMVAILFVSALGHFSHLPMIAAPFGASCILIFTAPKDKFAQPINVVFGYIISAFVGIIAVKYFPGLWWMPGVVLGVVIALMAFFRVTHPPAGALTLFLYLNVTNVDYDYLIFPIVTGVLALVAISLILHRLPPSREYPRKL